MLVDANLLDPEGRKWLEVRKEINMCREYEGARAAKAAMDVAQWQLLSDSSCWLGVAWTLSFVLASLNFHFALLHC